MPPHRLRGRTRPLRPSDQLLDGLTIFVTEGHAAAAPLLRRATAAFADEASDEASPRQDNFRWGWMTTIPPNILWDEDSWHAISARHLKEARDTGALARLPIDLADWGIFCAWCGDFGAAAVAIAETEAITTATGTQHCTLCPAVARRAPRPEGRLAIDRVHDPGGRNRRSGAQRPVGRVGERNPFQRAWPLRAGARLGPTSRRGDTAAPRHPLGTD